MRLTSLHRRLVALAAPLLVCAALVPLRDQVSPANLALLVMLVVVLVALGGDRVASALGALGGALWFDLFLTQPYGSLAIDARGDVLTAVLLLFGGIAVGEVAHRLDEQRRRRAAREDEIGRIYHVAELVASGAPTADVVAVVARELTAQLGLDRCRWIEGATLPPSFVLDHAGRVRAGDLEWDVARQGLPAGPIGLDVEAAGMPVGRFLLDVASGTPAEQYRLLAAVVLADQVGAAAARWPGAVATG